MNNKGLNIGIMDSGVGGLSVLIEALDVLPREDFVYIGDTLRMPYGKKTPKEVEEYTEECIAFLEKKALKAAVIACNTATCYGLENAQNKFDFPVLGVVENACEYACEVSKNKKMLLLATEGTVNSGVYRDSILEIDKNVNLREIGCPDLVIAIEDGHLDDDYVREIIENYLKIEENFDYDTLILGCTHFPLVRKVFDKIFEEMGKTVNIVDPAQRTILSLKKLLKEEHILDHKKDRVIDFYATGDVEKFKETAQRVIKTDSKTTFNKAEI